MFSCRELDEFFKNTRVPNGPLILLCILLELPPPKLFLRKSKLSTLAMMAFRYLVAMGLNDFLAQISSNQYWTKTKHVKNTHDLNKLILEVVLIIQPFPRR